MSSIPRHLSRFLASARAIVLALCASIRKAEAAENSGLGVGYMVVGGLGFTYVGLVASDIAFVGLDLGYNLQDKHVPKGVAVSEIASGASQLAILGAYYGTIGKTNNWTYALVGVPSVLALHGILTLTTADWESDRKPQPIERPRVSVAPTMLQGGTDDHPTLIPGLGAAGSF